jgi:hypothetical protein
MDILMFLYINAFRHFGSFNLYHFVLFLLTLILIGVPQVELAKFGPWGGFGGKPRDIKMAPCRLDSVAINSGDIIHSIQFSYTDHNGQYHTAGPWGGYGGNNNSVSVKIISSYSNTNHYY